MGDFAARDLWEASYVSASPAMPCQGCHGRVDPADRCYGDGSGIWHSRCWPERDGERRDIEVALGRWVAPDFTPQAVPSSRERSDG